MAKKKKPAAHYISGSIPLAPYIGLCLTREEFDSEMKRLRVKPGAYKPWIDATPSSRARMSVFEQEAGAPTCLVSLSTAMQKNPAEALSSLVHESVHIWQEHARYIGEESPGDEQEAYAIQRIYAELSDAFARRVDPKLKKHWKKP